MAKTTICTKNVGYSRQFIEDWADLIDWKRRRKGEGGFLRKVLESHSCRKVFNSCLGDGCDSIYLLKEGYDVLSNDLSVAFIRKAQENARRHSVKLAVTGHDWRELERHFPEGAFDAVLCLGNSLTHLFRHKDQLATLRNFRHILRRGGILLIDERNYQYILDKRKEILEGNFKYSYKYVYCGKKVIGYPVKISPRKVVFEYLNKGNGNTHHLELYPFRRGELPGLLKEAGFSEVTQYSDYKKGFNSRADFYTYVCVK